MGDCSLNVDRVLDLAGAICDQRASQDDCVELDSIVAADEAARRLFCGYCWIHITLGMEGRVHRALSQVHERDGLTPAALAPWESEALALAVSPARPPVPSALPVTLSTLAHSTIGYFSEGMPLAYLLATVIVGIGLLIGSRIYVSGPEQLTQQSVPLPSPLPPLPSSSPFVGRITGMVDCQWADESTAAFNGVSIPLGRKYALRSGLMQITYTTGAQVLLQGPCTYEVESAVGGYLSAGKLTARIDKKEERRTKNEERSASRSSFLIPHSYFSVRTPTAIVTDLGTEFGVDVGKDGMCEVHVLEGVVETQFLGSGDRKSQTVRLEAGEGRQYQAELDQVTAIPADRAKFAQMPTATRKNHRERWLEYSRRLRKDPTLVAYYTFEPVGSNVTTLPNLSSAGAALDGLVEGGEWVAGRLPGKLALYFHGPDSGDRVVLPEPERFEFPGAFTVAAWFRHREFQAIMPMLIAKGADSWRLAYDQRGPLRLGTKGYVGKLWQSVDGETRIDDGRWHLGVGVYEPTGDAARLRVYVDGHLDADNEVTLPRVRNDKAVWFGCLDHATGNNENSFAGWIDEVAIFSRTLSANEIGAMFEAGKPAEQPRAITK